MRFLGHNGAAYPAPPLRSPLLSLSSIILRWRVECSTAGSFLLLRGELRKQARASVMLLSLQGGEEMSCSAAKDDHLRACETRFPSGSRRDVESAKVPANELGLADVPQWWQQEQWQWVSFIPGLVIVLHLCYMCFSGYRSQRSGWAAAWEEVESNTPQKKGTLARAPCDARTLSNPSRAW